MKTGLGLFVVLALLAGSAWLPGPLHAAADPAPPEGLTASEWQGIQDQLALLVAPDGGENHHFGNSVSVSGDTAVVGAPWNGAAYVFYRDLGGPDAWGLVTKLTGDPPGWDFGYSVSVSDYYALVGAPGSGAAYLFSRNEGGADEWGQTHRLQGPDDFGYSVSVSADSLAAIVGAPTHNSGEGEAYVFAANDGVPWGTCAPPGDAYQFGSSVSVSGYTAVIGSWWNLDSQGRAFVCYGSQNYWYVGDELLPADGQQPGDEFGWSVSISGDTAVVGAPFRYNGGNVSGAAYVFYRDLGGPWAWGQAAKLIAPDDGNGGDFGWSVSVDGDAVAIGSEIGFKGAGAANAIQNEAGTAYVFSRDLGGADAWGHAATLEPGPDPWALMFGHSVSVSGDRAVVGAPYADVSFSRQGAAYVYSFPTSQPTLTLHLFKRKVKAASLPRPGWNKVNIAGVVHDQDHNAFAGATVAGVWTFPDGSTAPGVPLGPTGANGLFKFLIKKQLCGLFQFDVTSITAPGYSYDPAANEVPAHIEVSVPCR